MKIDENLAWFDKLSGSLDDAGKNIPVNIISKDDDGAGDQSIVWQPAGIVTNSTKDVKYHVVVDNVIVNGVKKKYEYDVNILKM